MAAVAIREGRVISVGALALIVWLFIGAVAAGQRHYYSSSDPGCSRVASAAVTIMAGPLNYVGADTRRSRSFDPQAEQVAAAPRAPVSARCPRGHWGPRGRRPSAGQQRGERHDLQGTLMRRREHDGRGRPVLVRAQPVGGRHAPPVSRHQPGEAELWHGGGQVVADAALVLEELLSYHRADRVTSPVFGPRGAAAIAVETGKRVSSTWLKLAAEYISVAHPRSIDSTGLHPQDSTTERRPSTHAIHILAAITASTNVPIAAKPWAMGTSTAGFGRMGRCPPLRSGTP